MPKGKIKFVNLEKKYGFITKEDGSGLHFKLQVVRKPTRWEDLQEGVEVAFEITQGPKGPTAEWVSLAGLAKSTPPSVSHPGSNGGDHRFLNPYNFVRWLTPCEERISESVDMMLLGHCPPPPHDRWVGLSGVIHCKAIAEAPMFMADAEGVTLDENVPKHKHYRFFKYGGKEAIPAASLRGPIRNVFEAATNSCFSNLADKRLSYHFDANDAPKLVPARVVYDKENDDWRLQLLTGTTPLSIGKTPDVQYAAWLHRYWPLEPSNTLQPKANKTSRFPLTGALLQRTLAFRNGRAKGKEKNISQFKHGAECFALLRKSMHPHPKIVFWDVIEVDKEEKKLLAKAKGTDERIEKGWLCLNNQNIESKHSERFFFRVKGNNDGPSEIELPEMVRADYEALIQDYQERHAKEVADRREKRGPGNDHKTWKGKKKMESALSRFVYNSAEKTLQGGELVYAALTGTSQAPVVKHIVPVSVPRVMFEQSILKRLPDHRLHRCKSDAELCPACRTFGWVRGEIKEQGAYASRVRFSHALTTKPIKMKSEILLSILSSPKPTTTRFYLVHKSWQSQERGAKQAGYDIEHNVLRGRKFYRHFGSKLNPREYTRATDENHNGKDDQNRTIHGVLDKGSEFTFSIRFENLASVELGALLWSLEMDGRGVHRLGLAKPLGFGSVRITIDDEEGKGVLWLDPPARYGLPAFGESGLYEMAADERESYVATFKRAMVNLYSPVPYGRLPEHDENAWNSAFEELDNVADLRALLNEPPPNLEIHYPRTEPEPKPDGENFKWFMANNYETSKARGEWIELEVPAEEVKNALGLPLQPRKVSLDSRRRF